MAASCCNAVIGELMLCLIASGLAIYGRGYLVRQELPRPMRPEPVVVTRQLIFRLFLREEAEHRVGVVVLALDVRDMRRIEHRHAGARNAACGRIHPSRRVVPASC